MGPGDTSADCTYFESFNICSMYVVYVLYGPNFVDVESKLRVFNFYTVSYVTKCQSDLTLSPRSDANQGSSIILG